MKNNTEAITAITTMHQEIDWDSIYSSELLKIYNFFIYMLGDRETAQDLTAITMERAWTIRYRYKSNLASLSTWLFGIARNVLKEHYKKYRSGKVKIESIAQYEEMSASTDVETDVQQQQEKDHLRKLLTNLPERERYLISLKYGAGLTNREIAKIANFSESNVGNILFRTVKNIREKMEEENGR